MQVQRFPAERVATVDVGVLGKARHQITGLLEVDVTEARARLRAHKQSTGASLSFTAWIIHVVALTLRDHPSVHSLRLGRRRRLLPDSVDVSTVV